MGNVSVSIIIVHYKVKQSLFDCLESIYKNTERSDFEVIVVDNDERKTISADLIKRYPLIKYVANENKGFAQGNNAGAKYASGKYLFFLNPDTIVYQETVSNLVSYLDKNKQTAIVAPVLLGKKRKVYEFQGFSELTPLKAVFALSFLNKIWPNNPISEQYWLRDSNKESVRRVSVVPGSAFLIRKKVFEELLGFDESFFLYFEENDLCKRVKDLGYAIVMIPQARVFHKWGLSTRRSNSNLKKIFNRSLFYYLKKHYGFLRAFFVSLFLRINSSVFILTGIICLSLFLRLYRISYNMAFIGDQGWFYLSARDMIVFGQIPLVGITSSHTWIHQGPLWTYMLAPALFVGGFNPLSGAYLTATLDVFAVLLIYKIGKDFFSKKIGVMSSLIYAASPAVIMNARMPYHTSPIPLFVLILIFSLLKWTVEKNYKYFPLILFSMSLLYNFELATVVFWPVILGLISFGLITRAKWALAIGKKKYLLLSLLGLITPMIPVIVYDLYNGFRQTLWYAAWFVYKPLQFISVFPKAVDHNSFLSATSFFLEFYSNLIFKPNTVIASVILITSIVFTILYIRKRLLTPIGIIFMISLVSILGFFIAKTSSSAYLPMLFPGLFFIFVFAMNSFFTRYKYVPIFLIILFSVFNALYVIGNIQFTKDFAERINASWKILKIADDREYNLIGIGPGSNFEASTMNYEYLTWWLGRNPPLRSDQKLKIIIDENLTPVGVRLKND